jgi:hypothetical protein
MEIFKMTYQQKFEELRADFHRKGEVLINAEKGLSSILGWGDSTELNDFVNAKSDFDQSAKVYHDFIARVKEKNVNPDDQYL